MPQPVWLQVKLCENAACWYCPRVWPAAPKDLTYYPFYSIANSCGGWEPLERRWELMKDPQTRSLAERLYVFDEFLPEHTVHAAHRANPRCSPWRAALIASATNLAVSTILFLFHKLNKKEEDRAVAGRKCMRCGSDEQPEVMLLCDEVVDTQRCTNALHLQCCRPRLASLPAGDCSWLCPVHDGRRRRRRPRAGGAVVDDEISIPEKEFQAQLNDTSDLVNRSVAVPLSERAMKRRHLQSLPIETLLALPMCYSPESLVGRLIMRGYHKAVSNARERSKARQRASGHDEDEASEGESGCSTEGDKSSAAEAVGAGAGAGSDTSQGGGASEGDSQGDSEVETGSGTDDSDDGEEFTKPVWTEATQHQIGCCPVCGDVKSLAWRYHNPKQGEVPVCGRCHFFHLHNTCLF